MKHILTNFAIYTKNTKDEPYIAKNGKPFKVVSIQVEEDSKNPQEYDGQKLSHCAFESNDFCLGFKEGDEVNILVEKNGAYWNFHIPSKMDIRLNLLESRVKVLEDLVLPKEDELEELPDKEELPDIEEDPDSIPF